ncbi:MAG TPA: universal stress protein [Polyangiaceae bacterium]|jgi:nucleotide-binding universal stress UspA family protein
MKKILAALDASPRASLVLKRAAALAASSNAELYLFRAVGLPPELPHDSFRFAPDEVVETLRATAFRQLEALTAELDPKLVVHVVVRIGSPWSAICESAKAHDVDLIVVGSHGYDALDHVLGTTAAKVVNHARCSVFVVRPEGPAKD